MASYLGGTAFSMAFHWFFEDAAREEVQKLRKLADRTPTYACSLRELYQGLPQVSGSVLCVGCTGYIGEAVVFEAVRRGLAVSVLLRAGAQARFEGLLAELGIEGRVRLVVGDVSNCEDLERTFRECRPRACICLVGSMVMDSQEQFDVDYQSVHGLIQVAHSFSTEQFIYTSAAECYQPLLPTQFHKLRIEGELMQCLPTGMQWTVLRPTVYLPPLMSFKSMAKVQKGQGLSITHPGDLALWNPIAREDLARFCVSCVSNPDAYSRVLAVGGPWSADNLITGLDAAERLTALVAQPSEGKPVTTMSLRRVDALYLVSQMMPLRKLRTLGRILFFYLKYWYCVNLIAPPTGTITAGAYAQELLEQLRRDPETFLTLAKDPRLRRYPLPRSAWWDISKPSLSVGQMPMGAGKEDSPAERAASPLFDADARKSLRGSARPQASRGAAIPISSCVCAGLTLAAFAWLRCRVIAVSGSTKARA